MITEKQELDIYDKLREAHKYIRAIRAEHGLNLGEWQENAIDAVDATLYLAESVFTGAPVPK